MVLFGQMPRVAGLEVTLPDVGAKVMGAWCRTRCSNSNCSVLMSSKSSRMQRRGPSLPAHNRPQVVLCLYPFTAEHVWLIALTSCCCCSPWQVSRAGASEGRAPETAGNCNNPGKLRPHGYEQLCTVLAEERGKHLKSCLLLHPQFLASSRTACSKRLPRHTPDLQKRHQQIDPLSLSTLILSCL